MPVGALPKKTEIAAVWLDMVDHGGRPIALKPRTLLANAEWVGLEVEFTGNAPLMSVSTFARAPPRTFDLLSLTPLAWAAVDGRR